MLKIGWKFTKIDKYLVEAGGRGSRVVGNVKVNVEKKSLKIIEN